MDEQPPPVVPEPEPAPAPESVGEPLPEPVEVEVLDALPARQSWAGESVALGRAGPPAALLIQTAAAAATGFAAGALTLALLRRAGTRRLARRDPWPMVPGQTYYVRVRVITGDRDPARG